MAPITLNCLVKGNSPASVNAFAVDIDSNKLISHLKRAIKSKKAPDFSRFAPDKLKLWKVEIYDNCDDKLAKLILHEHNELLATHDIKDYWTENPPKRHIHVIVLPPTASKKRKEVPGGTRSRKKETFQETPEKSLQQTRTRKELRLEGILEELSVDVMEDIIMGNSVPISPIFPKSLRHLCLKMCKAESKAISCYFEFGKVLKNQLDDFIEKKCVNARVKLNKEVLDSFPPGTPPNLVKKKMEIARKVYDLFSAIGENMIQRVRSHSADAIASLTKDEIGYIKGRFS